MTEVVVERQGMEVDICVIGSGLAGLSAVHYLLNNETDIDQKRPIVALVEARAEKGQVQTHHHS
jgi:glycine/D-amino acid oxidase-like deaminating enzyme